MRYSNSMNTLEFEKCQTFVQRRNRREEYPYTREGQVQCMGEAIEAAVNMTMANLDCLKKIQVAIAEGDVQQIEKLTGYHGGYRMLKIDVAMEAITQARGYLAAIEEMSTK